jgi:large subunit ribosomal protein L30
METKIKIKLVRSPICTPEKHKRVSGAWGCARSTRCRAADTPGFRGMVKKFRTLLVVVE